MMEEPESAERPFFKRLLSPWGIAIVILAIFAAGEIYLAWRDSAIDAALENSPAFATPALDVAFSKKLPYDPLAFVGRGARAGFWQWTPGGLVLTEEGRKSFEESGDMYISRAVAGKRHLKRIRTNVGTAEGDRRIGFLYEWLEVSPLAAILLVPPPHEKEEYPGEAVMSRENGSWQLKSLRTQDFEDSLAHLKQAASGVLR